MWKKKADFDFYKAENLGHYHSMLLENFVL